MRLWHKDLIPALPRQQLLGQWRECCLIAKSINEKGTPNHILVNRIMNYPIDHFCTYCNLVCIEMEGRGYRCDFLSLKKYLPAGYEVTDFEMLFSGWHNNRYLAQCYFNLQEKYDCYGISEDEWDKVKRMIEIKLKSFL